MGLKMDGEANFTNDVPTSEQPECKVPEDSNNSDNCSQYSEFGTCKLCNSGYELTSDSVCVLKDQEIEEEEEEAKDDNETISEDTFWQACDTDQDYNGWMCPLDSSNIC